MKAKKEKNILNTPVRIGYIQNFYGYLMLKITNDGRYLWGLEDWDGIDYFEIPKYLGDALLRYQKGINKKNKS